MADQQRPPVVDYHNFEIWRREDNSIDLYVGRDGVPVDREQAYREALVVARNIGEEINDAEEIFTIKVYESGLSSTFYRDYGEVSDWRRFRWVHERLHAASYHGVIALPQPPEWFMSILWRVGWWASRVTLWWQLRRGKWVAIGEEEGEREESPTYAGTSNLPAEGSNVVPFPGPRK